MHYDRALCGERHAAVVGVPHGGVKFLAEKGALLCGFQDPRKDQQRKYALSTRDIKYHGNHHGIAQAKIGLLCFMFYDCVSDDTSMKTTYFPTLLVYTVTCAPCEDYYLYCLIFRHRHFSRCVRYNTCTMYVYIYTYMSCHVCMYTLY